MKRIFIAIKIVPGQKLAKIITSLKSDLAGERITWVDPANIHITLAFLGDTEEGRIGVLRTLLRERCSGFGAFAITLKGTGLFRNLNDPRVIWVGIDAPDKLIALNEKIKTGLGDKGFITDDKPFKPHLTLGRIKHVSDKGSLMDATAEYGDEIIQEIQVSEVILYESILRSSGPEYRALDHFGI